MNYSEVKADLFSYYDKGYYLAHCISNGLSERLFEWKESGKRKQISYPRLKSWDCPSNRTIPAE